MEEKKLNIIFPANANYSEVVDSIADAFEVGILIEEKLKDGFQWADAFALIGVEPVIREIVNDAPEFLEQFLKLDGETAVVAVIEARDRLLDSGKKFGKVTNAIINFLYANAKSYRFAMSTFFQAQGQISDYKAIFSGVDILPPYNPARKEIV